MKRASFIILFILCALITSCLSLIMEKPSIVLRKITIMPRSSAEMNIFLGLDVQNPNFFDLTLKSFEYTVYLNNEKIGNGFLGEEVLIPSSSTTQVQVSAVAKFNDWGKNLKAIITSDNLPYKIKGKADIKTVFGSIEFPFSKEGHINI